MRNRRVGGHWHSQNKLQVTSIRSSLGDPGEGMRNRYIVFVVLAVLSIGFIGCTRNPETAKRKYLESGMKYMEQKKYDSAVIQFKKAKQIDPHFAEAHYQLALAEANLKHFREVYSELNQAIDINMEQKKFDDPIHLKARFALGLSLIHISEPTRLGMIS